MFAIVLYIVYLALLLSLHPEHAHVYTEQCTLEVSIFFYTCTRFFVTKLFCLKVDLNINSKIITVSNYDKKETACSLSIPHASARMSKAKQQQQYLANGYTQTSS